MEPLTIDGVLTDHECEALVREAEDIGFADAPITTFVGFEMRPEVRNNTRVILDDHARAGWLWDRMVQWMPAEYRRLRVVGLNERFRFYRYREGQYFQWHRDGSYWRSDEELSMLTLMLYLNDGFLGGRTEFVDHPAVEPRRGTALVFAHGLMHRGAPVLRGTKYVLRTDVMYRHVVARSA
ncbi:2OG-Fe(II) oxygenase [Paraliomyxa miuraensis]|uniref:2OG-Fe(II) oxygenase n=1 Tax=Paraliomyxa miuraensis TaxID=376150 RepID=UPI00224FEE45|nr:2OG-Fe(II) oxygenase [Paraliomyxa miuraensis]MCX4240868.1 2OG-Fe(II) oxygenase [Paraliomyxa miuraensis]